MPTKDSVVRTARHSAETWAKIEEYMKKEDLTYSAAIRKLIEEMDMPKQRKEYVNTQELVDLCEKRNIDPQSLVDSLVRNLKRG